MFSRQTFAKLATLTLVTLLLSMVLLRIDWLVEERKQYQHEAAASVAQSLAGQETLLGPLLIRNCKESWVVPDGVVKRQESRDMTLVAAPATLAVEGKLNQEERKRGLFKVNAYTSQLQLRAHWIDLKALKPMVEHPDGQLQCGDVAVMLAVSDSRGLRSVSINADGTSRPVKPGTLHPSYRSGLHAELPVASLDKPMALEVSLDLVGTERFELVPAAGSTQVKLHSNWPHPSFDGRFLPVDHKVQATGFEAKWLVSELASSAAVDVAAARLIPGLGGSERQVDTLGFTLLDPVNPYVMSDRAIKYGLLFIVLTFVSVGLVEVLGRRRVHPVQYLLVGLALSVFYLLLLSLSEHLGFHVAYAIAASAAAGLLAHYAAAMLGTWRRGLGFGAGIAGLYGVLFVLLSREQTALAIGAVLLFAVLAVVMALTRRLDWYGLGVKAS